MRTLVSTLLLGVLAISGEQVSGQSTAPAYVPPKGSYDVPASVIKPVPTVGTTVPFTLGETRKTGYGRLIQLKVLGLEELNRTTWNQKHLKQEGREIEHLQATSSDGKGGELGALRAEANVLLSQRTQAEMEAARDRLSIQIIEAGSPSDKPGATVVDLHSLPNQVSGSIFGIKVNNQIKITVTSQDFKPRVMIAHSAAAGLMSNPMMGASPVLTVGAETSEGLGTDTVVLTYDRSKPVPKGASTCIVVTSDDGRAVTGKYTLHYAK